MVTVGIVATISSLAVPGMEGALQNSQKSACISDTVGMLRYARTEAVRRQTLVAACASSDQASCDTDDWSSGYLVFVDNGAGDDGIRGDRDLNGDEEALRMASGSCSRSTVRSMNFVDAGGISFAGDGRPADRGTMVICPGPNAEDAGGVVLNIVGHTRMSVDSNNDGTVEAGDGSEVSCV